MSASDKATDGVMNYHAVTVMVTSVDEPGKVTLGTSTSNGTPQYLVGAILTATASDGDITNTLQDFTVDIADEVTGVTWRWYRGGAEITDADAQDNTYTLVQADANNRIRLVVTYQVDGNTNQERASLTTDYPVLAARIGANQLEFDPAMVSREVAEGDKGMNVGAPVTATGNHGTIRYSLDAGDDAARFEIDEKTGQITTDVDLDYEGGAVATEDAVGSCANASPNSPDRECTVTVTATDSTGEDPTTDATVTIMITDVDEKPYFAATGSQTIDVPENSTALFGSEENGYSEAEVGTVTYMAMDPEGLTASYSLTGPDASKFQTTGNPPVLSFRSKPDFEAKASADRDNVYEVTVRATAGGKTGERMVRVTVGNVDEAPDIMFTRGEVTNTPPEFASAATTRTVAEDAAVGADIGAPVEATDDDSGDTLTYTLSGTDRTSFTINSRTGQLMTSAALDFETKTSYSVTVTATDRADASDSIDVTITVTDVDDTADMTPLERYDTNDNDRIDKDELVEAIFDYNVNETLEKADLVDLIFSYEVG